MLNLCKIVSGAYIMLNSMKLFHKNVQESSNVCKNYLNT